MRENAATQNKLRYAKWFVIIPVVIGLCVSIALIFIAINNESARYYEHEHDEFCYSLEYQKDFEYDYPNLDDHKLACAAHKCNNAFQYGCWYFFSHNQIQWFFTPLAGGAILGFVLRYIYKKGALTVNDSRAYENAAVAPAPSQMPPQAPAQAPYQTPTPTMLDPTNQIVKYKKLLDDGIITEAEFNEKKKQLLGL